MGKKYPEECKTYLKIGTVRNPFDWFVSMYHHFIPPTIVNDRKRDLGEYIDCLHESQTLVHTHPDYFETSCFFSVALKKWIISLNLKV